MGNCSINILDRSKLELAWPKKSSSHFEINFPKIKFPILNTSVFKVHVLNSTLSKFLSNEDFLQYFPQHFLFGLVISEYILYPSFFNYFQQVSFTLSVSSLLSPLNDTALDIVDYEGSFYFSPELEFISPSNVHITLVTDTIAESTCLEKLLQC